jgi:hypothetical protein
VTQLVEVIDYIGSLLDTDKQSFLLLKGFASHLSHWLNAVWGEIDDKRCGNTSTGFNSNAAILVFYMTHTFK